MPYPTGHRPAVKKKIIESARRLFNRHGFESVSLNQIMAGAGLTHGGFYSYFESKSDLYAEVLGCFFTDPEWKSCWEGVHVDLSSTDVGSQVVRAYLSRQHFEDVENSCPMVALPTDVARSGVSAKRAFETVFKAMVSVLERSLVQSGRHKLETLANSEIFEIKTIAHDDFAIALASTGSRTTRPDMLRSRNAQSASFAASKAKVVIGGA